MEKISLRDLMSNEVLGLVKEKRSIMNIIMEREKVDLRGNGFLREVIGRMIAKRPRGRKRAMILGN